MPSQRQSDPSGWSLSDPPERWENLPGRTPLASVRKCEMQAAELVAAPRSASSLEDLFASPFLCWNASCRRCGPIVGRADFRRLAEAITGKPWFMLVLTLAPDDGSPLLEDAWRRRRRALEAYAAKLLERTEEPTWLLEPPPFDAPLVQRFAAQQEELEAHVEHATRHCALDIEVPNLKSPELSSNIWHAAQQAFTNGFRVKMREEFGDDLEYVLTWEITGKDRPHANVLVSSPRMWSRLEQFGGWEWRDYKTRNRKERGRLCRFSKKMRDLLQRWAIAAGFGDKRFWCEIAMPEDDALAGYVSKLALEMAGGSVKKQAPINRPPGFRRYGSSFEMLAPRHFPRGAPAKCPHHSEGCEHVGMPPHGWCARTIIRHLIEQHDWPRRKAQAFAATVRALHKLEQGHAVLVETFGLDAATRLEVIASRFACAPTEDEKKKTHALALAELLRDQAGELRNAPREKAAGTHALPRVRSHGRLQSDAHAPDALPRSGARRGVRAS